MPYTSSWVEPEEFLRWTGPEGEVVIYHVYRGDDMESGQRMHRYGTAVEASDENTDHSFDVRDLPGADTLQKATGLADELAAIRVVIIRAIESGTVKPTASDSTECTCGPTMRPGAYDPVCPIDGEEK